MSIYIVESTHHKFTLSGCANIDFCFRVRWITMQGYRTRFILRIQQMEATWLEPRTPFFGICK
uniref:Uncharacterized protein n=1 Tax=Aegilops tauschii subsp. strangulata TaxID=200361 RepID=A0A453BTC3_AEGTS